MSCRCTLLRVTLLAGLALLLAGCAGFSRLGRPRQPVELRLQKVLLERALKYEKQGEGRRAQRLLRRIQQLRAKLAP